MDINKRKIYYQKNKEREKITGKIWQEKQKDNIEYLKHRREISKKYNNKLRNQVIDLLGGKCVHCGFKDRRALQIDHINGGGYKDYKKYKGFYIKRVLGEILSGKIKYQCLCANCNWIKRSVKNETNEIR